MTANVAFERQVLGLLTTTLHERVAAIKEAGQDPVRVLGSPQEVAERMAATVPALHPWDTQVGPFYDTPGVTRLLGVSKQAVADRVKRRTLLSGVTRQGRVVYPVFQFRGGAVRPEISKVSVEFADCPVDGWAVCAWFTTPAADLEGLTPLAWLDQHRPLEQALELARETARRWRL